MQQQQQTNSTSSGTTVDQTNVDPIIQAIQMLEKKQRNLGKRKVRFSFLKYLFIYLFYRKNLKVMTKKQRVAKN